MRKRLLPEHVSAYRDRHGKERLRYRRKGASQYLFKSPFGTEEFRSELRSCIDGGPIQVGIERTVPGTISDLIVRYYTSSAFGGAPMTQRKNRGIFEAFRMKNGDRFVAETPFEKIDKIITEKAKKHPAAARNMRKQLRRLFAYAVAIRMIPSNPVDEVKLAVAKPSPNKETGFHTWSEAEIAKFYAKHALDSKPRLAMDLMLWTGCRRGDAVRLGPKHVRGNRIDFVQEKTGKAMRITITPQLRATIAASSTDGATFLETAYGQPFTSNGFGNWFRKHCDAAGLPQCSAHGLRKAIARRLADSGEGNAQIKSVTGHSGDSEVALYTRGVEQMGLADKVMARLSDSHLANLPDGLAI